MKTYRWLAAAAFAAVLCLGINQTLAQNNNNQGNNNQGNQGNRGGGFRGGGGNFDPAQFRERMMTRLKEDLEVTDDSEWKVIEPLITKVMDSRVAGFGGMGRRNRGGDQGGNNTDQGGNGGGRRGGMFGQASAESEALQKAIDGKASNTEMKAAIAKYVESRKTKQADLEKAQADLRKVLSVRQEAIAILNGLL